MASKNDKLKKALEAVDKLPDEMFGEENILSDDLPQRVGSIASEPCFSCKINNMPNCGNDHCVTNQKDWIQECGACGAKNETTWKKAVNERSTCCGTFKVEIYHKKNLKEKS